MEKKLLDGKCFTSQNISSLRKARLETTYLDEIVKMDEQQCTKKWDGMSASMMS